MSLPTQYQEYISLSRYARWRDVDNRRETFSEAVGRYFDYWIRDYPWLADNEDFKGIHEEFLNLGVVGSMRALMTAGPALDRDNVAGYNCAYTAVEGVEKKAIHFTHPELDDDVVIRISSPIDFDEAMYVLMCGTGVGFSVERQYINSLPKVGKKLNRRVYTQNSKNYPGVPKTELSTINKKENKIYVEDSKYGWASALRILLVELYNGNFDITWDVSDIRPAGARLKTFGGRASGPKPLIDLFNFSVELFKNAQGRKLTSIECHDLMCKIADIVVVGGVRRSALISLSNLTDDRMRYAKSGAWWDTEGQRALANNSVCYTEKPDMQAFMREWLALVESGSGERGIFYRGASEKLIPDRRKIYEYKDYGCNPCSEIILRSKQFCNLSEVVIRNTDTLEDLKRKVRYATILGTLQATRTNFVYLNDTWKKNTEEEALLGVSLTGIMDHPVMSGQGSKYQHVEFFNNLSFEAILQELKEVAIETNKEWSKKLGINTAAAITAVKPSGTVSQLVDSASGIHPRHSSYYIRTIRADKKDPLAQLMVDQGFPVEDDVMKPDSGYVFSFPIKSPETSVVRDDVSAIDQLELWKIYQLHWCEHKPSITVNVKPDEWLRVGSWVYDNFDIMSGVSFLPFDEHTYRQAPYQECTEEEYLSLEKMIPDADFSTLSLYEDDDASINTREYACTGNSCEIL
jgi:ribonucleoside-diphosphate reductase alpha chain